jgi:glycosyltransferase involved in cell wall biosynthesis
MIENFFYFDSDFNYTLISILLAIFLVSFVVQSYYYLYFFTGVIVRNRKAKAGKINFSCKKPPVSVIICAKDEQENLQNFLPLILEQDYPDFEVIVVNDASTDDSEEVLKILKNKYPNLYVTNIPVGTKVLSSKKLAVVVGIKAAKNEILLFTDADCYPVSKNWISLMVRNISPNTEFVLGFGGYIKSKSLINRLITFDTLFIAMQYMGLAFRGLPYMAVGRNMMYRKSTFFRLKGFVGHLHIASGDDDLIVNKAANKTNTAIEANRDSKTLSLPEVKFGQWLAQKRRHLSVSGLYSFKSKSLIGLEILSRGLFYLSFMLVLIFGNLFFMSVATALFLIRYIIQSVIINKTAKNLNNRKFFILLILFDMFLPLIALYLSIYNSISKKAIIH